MNNIEEKPKIFMGILVYKYVTSIAFGHHMATLLDGINTGYVKKFDMRADMYVTMARNDLCRAALQDYEKGEATHLLTIDDDMLLLPGTIKKLADMHLPVVSGAYFTRDLKPCVYAFEPKYHMLDTIPDTGNIVVDGVGAGCLLIDLKVLKDMKEYFKDEWWFQNTLAMDDGIEKYMGEDVFFFRRLKEMNIPVTLNCDVQCGHCGTAIADLEGFKARQAEIAREQGVNI
jgi:hypothetical protein